MQTAGLQGKNKIIMNNFTKALLIVPALAASVLFQCCSGKKSEGAVQFNDTMSVRALAEQVSGIEILPLEADESHMTGSIVELHLIGNSFLLVDKINTRIYRYSPDGKFLCEIGRQGNGPGEYVNVGNIQVKDGCINVFSRPSKLLKYSFSGEFLEALEFDDLGGQSYETGEGILTYYGYGSGRGNRLGLVSDMGTAYMLPSSEKVLNMDSRSPIFSEGKDCILFTDTYSNTVKSFREGEVSTYLAFDLGKYAIPEDFFKHDDSFAAMETLMSGTYALVENYQEDGDSKLVNVKVQAPGKKAEEHLGLFRKGAWKWFSAGELGVSPLAGGIQAIKGDSLYCTMDPYLLKNFPKELLPFLADKNTLSSIPEDGNTVIAIVKLK